MPVTTLLCLVIAISDGDTLTARCGQAGAYRPLKVRIAAIDAPEEAPILQALDGHGWKLTHIFTTHHHQDHVEANLALKEKYGCQIIGPRNEAAAIPGLDRTVGDGDEFTLGDMQVDEPAPGVWAPDSHDVYLWQAVQRLRREGVRVVQALPGQEIAAAAEAGCDRQLQLCDGRWQVAPLAF